MKEDNTLQPVMFQILVIFMLIMIFFAIGENTKAQKELNKSLNPKTQQDVK